MVDEYKKLREYESKNLGVLYIAFDDCFLTDKGVKIDRDEIRGKTNKFVKELHDARAKTTDVYDYEYARTTGYIRRKKQETVSAALTTPAIPDLDEKLKNVLRRQFDPVKFIQVITLLVGVSMLFVSVHYTHAHIAKYTDPFVAWVFALGLCTFSTIAFESSLLFWRRKGCRGLSVLFMVLFCIVVTFTITSNADVIYERCKSNRNDSETSLAKNEAESSVSSMIASKLDNKKREVADAEENLRSYKSGDKVSSWRVSVLQSTLDKKRAERDSILSEQIDYIKQHPEATVTKKLSNDTFYKFLGRHLHRNPANLETMLNMLSILFVDIVAPASFAVAIFLGGQNAEREGKEDGSEKHEES